MSRNFKDIVKDFQHALNISYQNTRNIVKVSERYLAELAEAEQSGGGSSDYSTTEHVVGKWIDGITDVYEKTFTAESASSAQSLLIPHGITGLDTVISLFGGCKTADRFYPLPFVENDISYQRYLAVNATDIIIGNAANAMAISKIVVTIRYTKNA